MTRADWLLVVIVAGCLPVLYHWLWQPAGPARWVEIQSGDAPSRVVTLSPDRQFEAPGPLGESRIETRDGQARFVSSPCTGKVCIHTGWLEQPGEVAACLPNRISIRMLGRNPAFDALNF
jgi:hypothetical protein